MRVQTETKGKSASAISSTWRLRPSAYSDEAGSDDDLGILPVLVTVMVMVVVVVMVVMRTMPVLITGTIRLRDEADGWMLAAA